MKTKEYKPITKAQITKIHVLLNQRGLMGEKRSIIHSVSNGRTVSSKELTSSEAAYLINFLVEDEDEEKKKALFKVIYALAWQMGIIYGNTDEDYQMNKAKLNMFCRERGTVKKNLSSQNLLEMRKTHRQFEAMFKKYKVKTNLNN